MKDLMRHIFKVIVIVADDIGDFRVLCGTAWVVLCARGFHSIQ